MIAIEQGNTLLHVQANTVRLAGGNEVVRTCATNPIVHAPILSSPAFGDRGGKMKGSLATDGRRYESVKVQDIPNLRSDSESLQSFNLFRPADDPPHLMSSLDQAGDNLAAQHPCRANHYDIQHTPPFSTINGQHVLATILL